MEEREWKIVIAGLPHSTDPASNKEELETENFTTSSISNLIKKLCSPVTSFQVKLKRVVFSLEIYDMTSLMYLQVQVRAFNARPSLP